MVHVTHIDAPEPSPDCTWIRHLFLNNGEQISPDDAHRRLLAGALIRVGSPTGPALQPAVRGAVRYVRATSADSSDDKLLHLPRKF